MKTNRRFLLAAIFGFALTFTFSCSGGDDGDGNSNNSNGGFSSPSGGGSSSSGGRQGVPFNENSQIYDEDGVLYKGSGDIKISTSNSWQYNEILIDAGSVTNGIVNLKLPQTIPDEYLDKWFDVNDDENQLYCTSYPKYNIRTFVAQFVLISSNGDEIGSLSPYHLEYEEKIRISERIDYYYFSKAGKVTCKYKEEREGYTYIDDKDYDVKEGWNTIYLHRENTEKSKIHESSTNNILIKGVNWIIYYH